MTTPGIGDQVEEPAADVLGLDPRLGNRIRPHHPLDQFVGNVVGAHGLHHRRVHRGRTDDVDRDALLGDLQGHGLREPDDSPLGGVVRRPDSGMPIRPPIDEVTTIRPNRCRRITGTTARRV